MEYVILFVMGGMVLFFVVSVLLVRWIIGTAEIIRILKRIELNQVWANEAKRIEGKRQA